MMARTPRDEDLPASWEWATISDITEPIKKVDPGNQPDAEFLYLDISSIDNTINRVVEPKVYRGREAPSRARQVVRAGDTLFSTVRTYLKNIAVVPDIYDGQIASTGFSILRATAAVEPRYLFYYSLTSRFLDSLEALQRGTSYPAVRDDDVRAQAIPVAPLAEQRRVVAAIEEHVTRLDAAVASLKRAQANLRRYRAAVLKAACEGKLVPQDSSDEPVSVLLERILAERRARWEAEQRAKGRDPGKARYAEPQALETNELPRLPEGWSWASFEQISERVTVGHVGPMKDEYINAGIPFLRSQNVRPNRFDPTGLKYVAPYFHHRLSKSSLTPGDILVVRSGSVGIACVMPETYSEANCSDLVIVKRPIFIVPNFAAYYMNSIAQTRVRSKQVGIALTHFNTQSMAAMPLPLPPLAEQKRIVDEVEKRLSEIDQLEAEVDRGITRASRLRQGILARAFAGQLVHQDPNDEPASLLLERIRAARQPKVLRAAQHPLPLRGPQPD